MRKLIEPLEFIFLGVVLAILGYMLGMWIGGLTL